MPIYTIALFGEAEKGEYSLPYLCDNLSQLSDNLGNPPDQSRGLFYAIQALLYHRRLIFFRVKEEGFSLKDYLCAVALLKNHQIETDISAFYLPGVGNSEILEIVTPVCKAYNSFLITNELDYYDFLTQAVA